MKNEIKELTYQQLKNVNKITIQHAYGENVFLTETYIKREGVEFWDYFSVGEEPEDEGYGTFSTEVIVSSINETIKVVKRYNVGLTDGENAKCNIVLE